MSYCQPRSKSPGCQLGLGPRGQGSCLGATPWKAANTHCLSNQKSKHLHRRSQTQLAEQEAPGLTPHPPQWILGGRDKEKLEAR